jgi:hypothetical protein
MVLVVLETHNWESFWQRRRGARLLSRATRLRSGRVARNNPGRARFHFGNWSTGPFHFYKEIRGMPELAGERIK